MSAKEQKAFFHMHAQPYRNFIDAMRQRGYKVIFLLRDPGDQAVSLLYFIQKGWHYGPLNTGLPYGLLSFEEQLHEVITGQRFGVSGTLHLMGDFIPWIYEDPELVCALDLKILSVKKEEKAVKSN